MLRHSPLILRFFKNFVTKERWILWTILSVSTEIIVWFLSLSIFYGGSSNNRSTMWPNCPIPGTMPKPFKLNAPRKYGCLCVDCSTIHNSQVMDLAKTSATRRMEALGLRHRELLVSYIRKWDCVTCEQWWQSEMMILSKISHFQKD